MVNILLIGSGGREHAMAWKMKQSPLLNHLYIAPGNAGTAQTGENINVGVTDFPALKQVVIDKQIDLVVVGPEVPLVAGLHNFFKSDANLKHVKVVGPEKAGAMLEGSKDFAKDFMIRHEIPTARHSTVTKDNLPEGHAFLKTLAPPYVLKADGLAAGKGVLIIEDREEAEKNLEKMLGGMFGSAGNKVVIEEFLSGIELSVFVITDGKNYRILPEAKDYKRIGEGDTGPNTGGMGAVSPVPFASYDFMQKVENKIIKPTIEGLSKENIPYCGFIFFGLINCKDEPYVIEYNVRMGDPETEVVMLRLQSDFVEMLLAAANGTVDKLKVEQDSQTAVTVMLVSGGYPDEYEKGKIITGFEKVDSNSIVFHAGTKQTENGIVTDGGRVLCISSKGQTKSEALKFIYANAGLVNFEGKYFRNDIGFDL